MTIIQLFIQGIKDSLYAAVFSSNKRFIDILKIVSTQSTVIYSRSYAQYILRSLFM